MIKGNFPDGRCKISIHKSQSPTEIDFQLKSMAHFAFRERCKANENDKRIERIYVSCDWQSPENQLT